MKHAQQVEIRFARSVVPLLLILVVELCCAASPAVAQQTLRWKFQPGLLYRVTFQQETTSKTPVGDQAIEVRLQMTMEMDWKIIQVDEAGLATMEQSFTRIRIALENPGVESLLYDSSATSKPLGEAAQIAASLSPLIGKPFRVVMSSRGAVQKVTLSAQAQAALNQVPAESRLKDVFTTAGLAQTLQRSHAVLPEQAVQAGDTWESDLKVVTPLGDLKIKTTYRYLEAVQHADVAAVHLGVQGELKLVPAKETQSSKSPPKIKSQKMSGQIFFARDQGWMVSSEMTQSLVTESRYGDLLLTSHLTSRLATTVRRLANP